MYVSINLFTYVYVCVLLDSVRHYIISKNEVIHVVVKCEVLAVSLYILKFSFLNSKSLIMTLINFSKVF